MHKLIVLGSARMDAFLQLPITAGERFCRLDTKDCYLALTYAAKIPLQGVEFLVGGNGANVAVGATRLGVPSLLVAEIGDGVMTPLVWEKLAQEIKMDKVTKTPGVPQGFGAVITYQGERTILSYYPPFRPQFPKDLEPTQWAYLTSVGENFEEFCSEALHWVIANNVHLAFNPSGRQLSKGISWLSPYLKQTQVLFVNREEAQDLVGEKDTHGKEKELLGEVAGFGSKMVVITDGENGAYGFYKDRYYRAGVLPVNAYERTGAGDAFSTGCLAALIEGKGMDEALLWGTINSASVIGHVGSQKGLLKKEELPTWLERAKSSGVTVGEF